VDNARGKQAITRFKLIRQSGDFSLIEAAPETGRTNQIRVHLAALGYPIVCDTIYGTRIGGTGPGRLRRLGLHAAKLVIPAMGLSVEAPLPRDMVF
jgi:23S rRNA-/tRNA-specific pseudouridylate synthase